MNEEKYKVLENIKFLHSYIFCDKKHHYMVLSLVVIVMNIIVALMPALLPAFVINLLINKTWIYKMIFYVSTYIIIMQGFTILNKRIEANILNRIDMKRLEKCTDYYEIMMTTAFENVESPSRIQAFIEGLDTFYDDYHVGLTHLIVDFRVLVQSFVGLIVYCLLIARISPLITLFIVLVSSIHVLANSKHKKWIKDNIKTWKVLDVKLKYINRESTDLKNGKDARSFSIEKWFNRKMDVLILERKKWFQREAKSEFKVKLTKRVLTFIKYGVAYIFVMNKVKNGLQPTAFILMIGLILGIDQWVTQIFDHYVFLTINNVTVNKFRRVMDYENREIESSKSESLHKEICDIDEIRFENVYYAFDNSDAYVISDLNLSIRKGEKIALVGKNGAGKSTLVKLLCGLYRPTKGSIYINGIDTSTLSQTEIMDLFSVMFQNNSTFAFSVAENVSCKTYSEMDLDKVESSLKDSQIYKRIMKHPQGLNAQMTKEFSKDGIVLSGGEHQKLMFARMLYDDGQVAILDEPTAAMDAIAESEFYRSFNGLLIEKACLFISHRLSSTKFCDRIIFMDKGKIIEEGSHEDLLRKPSAYSELYTLQASYYLEEAEDVS